MRTRRIGNKTALTTVPKSAAKRPSELTVDPCRGRIGKPPARLTEEERDIWNEIADSVPNGILTASDRLLLDVATTLTRSALQAYGSRRDGVERGRDSLLALIERLHGRQKVKRPDPSELGQRMTLKQVAEYGRVKEEQLRLQSWNIRYEWLPKWMAWGDAPRLGDVGWHRDSLEAWIRIKQDGKDLKHTITHELLHLRIEGHQPCKGRSPDMEAAINVLADLLK